jgi:hypothetical protein
MADLLFCLERLCVSVVLAHDCLVESARFIYIIPDLFWHFNKSWPLFGLFTSSLPVANEPASMLLLGTGLAGVAYRLRKKRAK